MTPAFAKPTAAHAAGQARPPSARPAAKTAADITVVIVNWNGGALLLNCLKHLRRQTLQPTKILVVDNASSDNSLDMLTALPPWPELTIIRAGSNLGFAAGNNLAINQCNTEFVALLNPDAFAAEDWLEQLHTATQSHPDAASFGSRQLCHESPAILDGTGDCYHISGLAWRQHHGHPQTADHLQEREIFAPCAAAALYRRSALVQAEGFDESYFCYHEDVDLGFRLRLLGHTARYVPRAVVHHVGSATTGGQRSSFATYHGHRNLVWTFLKNMPAPLLWPLLPLHLAANGAMLIVLAQRGQGHTALRAKWHALQKIRTVWRQRKSIQVQRKATTVSIWRALHKSLWPRPRKR